ncbi:hypothetical protein C4D60_Mb05t26000 [Musa balbisiana]|uniref:Uncharacterized protein n=1 Tax=Musa balbisiana TaxID=52838 RepID=A0A4S8JYZ4_MUSBA|nr:hypothetical protein C4D60_Mb05t26000 [Musa balbisiana]
MGNRSVKKQYNNETLFLRPSAPHSPSLARPSASSSPVESPLSSKEPSSRRSEAWLPGTNDPKIMPASRHRAPSRRPLWILAPILLVCMALVALYVHPLQRYSACYFFSSSGHGDKFSIYIHASREKPEHISSLFVGKEIHSEKVAWGKISMVDAEKRLLANALQDIDNQHFVLLSDSCVPLHKFDYIYNYLLGINISFIDGFKDPGPHGAGRYSEHMLPEIEKEDFRKGAQWFSIKRQHAVLILADSVYYTKFKLYCRPRMEGRNCYADEHYLPTLFHMVDPGGIANWSVTHVDWSEGKWHPKAYRARDVTFDLLKNIISIDESIHVTSDSKKVVQRRPCLWNGMKRPCYLFARKFYPEALNSLMHLLSNLTII